MPWNESYLNLFASGILLESGVGILDLWLDFLLVLSMISDLQADLMFFLHSVQEFGGPGLPGDKKLAVRSMLLLPQRGGVQNGCFWVLAKISGLCVRIIPESEGVSTLLKYWTPVLGFWPGSSGHCLWESDFVKWLSAFLSNVNQFVCPSPPSSCCSLSVDGQG